MAVSYQQTLKLEKIVQIFGILKFLVMRVRFTDMKLIDHWDCTRKSLFSL